MTDKIRKQIDISKEHLDWLESHYPGGSFAWLVDKLLGEFISAHTMTPTDYAAIGAKTLYGKIGDEV